MAANKDDNIAATTWLENCPTSARFREARPADELYFLISPVFSNLCLTSGEFKSLLAIDAGGGTEDLTYHTTNADNVKSKIHLAGGQDHHFSITMEQWMLARTLVDLISWTLLNESQISSILTRLSRPSPLPQPRPQPRLGLYSNLERIRTLNPTLLAPPPPPPPPAQGPRQRKEHHGEPQSHSELQAVIPRSWRSSSASSSSLVVTL